MAIITKTIASEVMNIVMVVELPARWGIFKRALLVIMKNRRARKAKPAPNMKCQSISIRTIFIGVSSPPEMKDLEPVRRIEITVTIENRIV